MRRHVIVTTSATSANKLCSKHLPHTVPIPTHVVCTTACCKPRWSPNRPTTRPLHAPLILLISTTTCRAYYSTQLRTPPQVYQEPTTRSISTNHPLAVFATNLGMPAHTTTQLKHQDTKKPISTMQHSPVSDTSTSSTRMRLPAKALPSLCPLGPCHSADPQSCCQPGRQAPTEHTAYAPKPTQTQP